MVIKHSTTHNPNDIVPSADWNADHTGTAPADPHTHTHASTTGQTSDDHHPQAHTLASHSTKAHTELTNVTSDQHHPQAHTLASHSTKAHTELTNVTADQHHNESHNMASHTDDYSAGGGIDISIGNVISGEDATTANKGIASFNSFDFSVVAGAVSLDDDVLSTIGGDAGTATGLNHNLNILGGEGIDTSGLADDITISGEDASTTNKGIAKFNTNDFSVSAGNVSLKNKTSYWSCSGTNFIAEFPSLDAVSIRSIGHFKVEGGTVMALAPVFLPHGAVVTSAICHGNAGTEDSTWYLRRITLATGGVWTMATNTFNLADNTIDFATIDNSLYAYFIYADPLVAGDEIDGAKITYTTDYD